LEDYLEAIFHIIEEKRVARSRDIAARLKVKTASVTGALHALAAKAMIHYSPYDVVTLTETGEAAARNVVRRHNGLRDFFVSVLGAERSEAESAACRMEHALPDGILEKFLSLVADKTSPSADARAAPAAQRTEKP
jgi:DtxR family Mn-dependent transcriptional regulator